MRYDGRRREGGKEGGREGGRESGREGGREGEKGRKEGEEEERKGELSEFSLHIHVHTCMYIQNVCTLYMSCFTIILL